jgi:hypothetical protein
LSISLPRYKTLATLGESVQLAYLYKTLKEMCEEGLLESRVPVKERGVRRRLYRLTSRGRKELGMIFSEATELIHDFYETYVSRLSPAFFLDRFRMMMMEVYGGRESVALLTSERLTTVHREILEGICKRKGGRRTYLIKPPRVKVDVEFPTLTVLDGTFDDLPLKDGSLDAMVVVDVQDASRLRASCREFRRVLKRGGIMCGCAPFLGWGGEAEPLELGEFLKKMKYLSTGRPYHNKEAIRKALSETFDSVDIAGMSFLTAFVAARKPFHSVRG